MTRKEMNPEDAEALVKSVYQRKVRPTLNGEEEPIGYFLSVDLETEDWELDEHPTSAPRCNCGSENRGPTYSPSASVFPPPVNGSASNHRFA